MAEANDQNGWSEYRRMIIDWHQQEVSDRAAIQTKLEIYQGLTTKKLEEISLQIAELKAERGMAKWFLTVGVPAFVALGSSFVLRRLGL